MHLRIRNTASIVVMLLASATTLCAQSWTIENIYGGVAEDRAVNLASQPDGYVTHIAYTYSMGDPATYPNVHIVQSDPLGYPVWEKVYDIQVATPLTANIWQTEMSIYQAANGDFIWTTGVHASGGTECDIMVCRIDKVGAVIWTRTIGVNNSSLDCATSVIEDPTTNEIYITGFTTAAPTSGGVDVVVAKFDAAGGTMWNKKFGTVNNDRGRCIRLLANGDVVVVGETRALTASWNGMGMVINSAGAIVSDAFYGIVSSGWNEYFHSVVQHPSGNVYACGSRLFSGNRDVYVVEFDPLTGFPVNSAIYNFKNGGDERGWYITRGNNAIDLVVVGQVPEASLGGSSDGFRLDLQPDLSLISYSLYGTPFDDALYCIEASHGSQTIGPTDYGYWMAGYNNAGGSDDEHLLRTNFVGKTNCYLPENIMSSTVTGGGPMFSSVLNSPGAATYQLDGNPVFSFDFWCPGQYFGLYQAKSGLDLDGEPKAQALDLQISPQPLTLGAEATLNFTLDNDADLEIALFDMRGRQVYTFPFDAVAGANTFSFVPSGLNSGTYVIQLEGLSESAAINLVLIE